MLCGLLGGETSTDGAKTLWAAGGKTSFDKAKGLCGLCGLLVALECPYNDCLVVLRARLQNLHFLKTAFV